MRVKFCSATTLVFKAAKPASKRVSWLLSTEAAYTTNELLDVKPAQLWQRWHCWRTSAAASARSGDRGAVLSLGGHAIQ